MAAINVNSDLQAERDINLVISDESNQVHFHKTDNITNTTNLTHTNILDKSNNEVNVNAPLVINVYNYNNKGPENPENLIQNVLQGKLKSDSDSRVDGGDRSRGQLALSSPEEIERTESDDTVRDQSSVMTKIISQKKLIFIVLIILAFLGGGIAVLFSLAGTERGAKQGVVLLESEGTAAEYVGGFMGYYDELPEKLNERPTYGQRGGGGDVFMSYDGVHKWWVNDQLGANRGWLYAKSDSLLPPTSGWFFAVGNYSWLEAAVNDTSLKLTQNPTDLGNCNNINISAAGPAGVKFKEHLGLYEWKSGEMLNGRKLYYNGHAYLRVRTGKIAWRTGGLKDGWLSSGGLTSGKATSCPCSKNAGPTTRFDRDWWAYYDNNEYIVDMSITVTCV